MFDLINEILQTLRNNKLRTALTGLSVAWGVFMLVALLGVSRGVTNNFAEVISSGRTKLIQVWGGMTTRPYDGLREGRSISLKDADIEMFDNDRNIRIAGASSVIYGDNTVVSSGSKSVNAGYNGVYPSARKTDNLTVTEGRFINERDMDEKSRVVVLSEDFAKQLFPPDGKSAVGKRVSLKGLSFLVVGIYSANWYREMLVPYTTARNMQKDTEAVGSLRIDLKNVNSESDGLEAEEHIRTSLAASHRFDKDDDGAVWINNRFNDGLRMQSGMDILTTSVWALGLLSLLSGIVGISNIMFVSVKERTHEIGIRRAIGARPRSILVQVIAEAVAITTIFGYIGIVLGMIITQIIGAFSQNVLNNPTINLSLALEVTAVLVLAGALAGFFPAMKAIKIKPVEALRDE